MALSNILLLRQANNSLYNIKLSLFTWQWIFLRDHFLTIPIPSLVSFFESERYRDRVRSRFFWVNDTDTESGLVFLKLTIPRPSPVSIFLIERYRYRVRSRFLKLTIPEPRLGLKPLKVRDFNETRPRREVSEYPVSNYDSIIQPHFWHILFWLKWFNNSIGILIHIYSF